MFCSTQARLILSVVASFVLIDGARLRGFAAGPAIKNVGRMTHDRDEDLIQALLDRGRFDDALDLCKLRSVESVRRSDVAAKWKIRESKVLTARQMGRDTFSKQDLTQVQRPVSDLLRSYPDHPRLLFLKSQLLSSEKSAALYSVLRAAVSPRNEQVQELAMRRLLTAMDHVSSLAEEIQDKRSALESHRTAASRGLIADLRRLGQQLQIDAVSLALVQTDLFPQGSADCIAAATKAEQVADDAITRLPAGTTARKEIERLRVEAVFRAAQFERCDALLNQMTPQFTDSVPSKLQALRVRLRIAQGQLEKAGKLLADFFGDVPEVAPNAMEMDLARLEFLLVANAGRRVGDWLDAIQSRGGAYARRRADAVSLSHLESTGQSKSTIDPSLVAAQGQDWLRRGDPSRAGDLLAAAAAAESDPDRAMSRVAEAAAALLAAKRTNDAIQLMQDIPLAKPTAEKSPATHLQAAILIARLDLSDPATVKRLEAALRVNLQRWPDSSAAASIRSWLGNILKSQARYLEAAKVLSIVKLESIDNELAQAIADAWILVLEKSAVEAGWEKVGDNAVRDETASWQEATTGFQAAMSKLGSNDVMRSHYRLISALHLDQSGIGELKSRGPDTRPVDSFIDSFIAFRLSGESPAESPPAELLDQVERRLMLDARDNPALRQKVVKALAKWLGVAPVSMNSAQRWLWQSDSAKATELLKEVMENSKDPRKAVQQAAAMLGSTDDTKAQRAGVALWDELAAGLPQGTRSWHEAKLAAVRLLQRIGDQEEAYRRARFVLLTQTTMDEDLRRQYQLVKKKP
ncbi:hypothetical protein N9B25_00945 [bacterium]|nr:hypothetical protein [bacterium]MDA7907054.1 hypothetical protein [bacterium]MDA7914880.1 hypothetical protein [bacterium]